MMIRQKNLWLIFILFGFLANPIVNAQISAMGINEEKHPLIDMEGNLKNDYPGWSLEKKIAIYYDPSVMILAELAVKVYHSTGIVYHNTYFIKINSWEELGDAIKNDDYWIKLYFIDGGLDGITLDTTKNWTSVVELLEEGTSSHHIFGAGSTDLLNQSLSNLSYNPTNIHFEGSDIIDAELSYFYNLWEIGDIMATNTDPRYQRVSEDFRILGIQYFASNMNNLINKQLDPIEPLGQENVELKRQLFDDKIKGMSTVQQVLPNGGTRDLNSNTPAPRTIFVLQKDDAQNGINLDQGSNTTKIQNPFTIADIPLFSGLNGPASKVIDTILQIIIQVGGSKLGLDPQTANDILSALKEIVLILSNSNEGEGDYSKTLRSILLSVGKKAPIPDKLKEFFPLIVDAFFLLRGEVTDIVTFGKTAITTIFKQISKFVNSTVLDNMLTVLEQVLLNGAELTGRMVIGEQEADAAGVSFEPLTEIQNFVFDKLLSYTTYEWITTLLGKNYPNSTITKEVTQILNFVVPLVKAFVKRDFNDLFKKAPGVIEYVANKTKHANVTNDIELSTKTEGGIEFSLRVFHLAMNLYDQYSDLGGNLGALLSSGQTSNSQVIKSLIQKMMQSSNKYIGSGSGVLTIPYTKENTVDFANALLALFTELSIVQLNSKTVLKTRITAVMSVYGFPTTSTEANLVIDAFVLLGSIIIPSIPEPLGYEFRKLATTILNSLFTTTSPLVLDAVKVQFFALLDVSFGLLGSLKFGGSAQVLFIESKRDLTSDGKISQATKTRILLQTSDQMSVFITGFIKNYISNTTQDMIPLFSNVFITLMTIAAGANGEAIKATIQAVLIQAVQLFIKETLGLDARIAIKLIVGLFAGLIEGKSVGQSIGDAITENEARDLAVQALRAKNVTSQLTIDLAKAGVGLLYSLKDLFGNTMEFIFTQLKAALSTFLVEIIGRLETSLRKMIGSVPFLRLNGTIGFAGADFLGIELYYDLSLSAGVKFDKVAFVSYIMDIIFNGIRDLEDPPSAEEFFPKILKFLTITPIFSATLGVNGMASGKGGLFSMILGLLGADLSFSGEIYFKLQLLSFKAGGFDPEGFVKLLEWGLSITITLSRDFTIFDVVTAGAGGGALNKVAKYIGLDALVLTIYVTLAFQMLMKAAHNGKPATGSLTLSLTLGAYLTIGLDLVLVGIKLQAGIDIILTFFQDLSPGSSKPFKITLDIVFWVKVVLTFLFWDFEAKFTFRPPGSPYNLTPTSEEEIKENAFGVDSDNDGLSDEKEEQDPNLDPNKADTDDDGLSDKFELLVSKTDPSKLDTDGDGLSDFAEWHVFHTDPLVQDTDLEGLTDYEEVAIYGTNPLSQDTDNDLLTDYWEVTQSIDISKITPSVTSVIIGGKQFNDHTDPLNPDTDNDGLLDGEEGEFGPYWGDESYYSGLDPILLFNEGYTHPLDNDTDDDSYLQLWDGTKSGAGATRVFLRDMTDGVEVAGIRATTAEIDSDGMIELVSKVFHTNPTNPDSDGDTGTGDPRVGTFGFFINSDGYELTLDPASDPLDSDSDDDGLIDGLEGTLRNDRNATTYYLNPDTDGDGLPDGLEMTLGTDPGNPDTDGDLVLDGDEFFLYHTNPFLPDTDFDGIDDGWELFFSHSNPHSQDTDADGLTDYEEIFIYGTDPVDEDSDNDGLTDRDEVLEFETDPNNADSDEDGLRDGEEIFVYETDPNNADTDSDSILYPDENGNPTFLWNDGQEVEYGTNPRAQDTDEDGLLDSWEIYVATVDIPNFENIPVDPLVADTDNDGILDGQEMQINETQNLIYPYVAIQVFFPFLTSPVNDDTDEDGLSDKFEIDNGLRPDLSDSDGDGLSDWDELFIHLTDPTKADTDGDGIIDSDEVTSATNSTSILQLHAVYAPKYATSATEPDSDHDGWPDGLEINATDGDSRYNPYDNDTNNNGVLDGYERDFDNDQVSDGDEYYTFNSGDTIHGGFLDYRNPDSDFDGLTDGDEILIYGTKPYNHDTDFDGFSDSLELWIGTDPLVFTTEDEFFRYMSQLNSPIQIRSPEEGRIYGDGDIEVEIFPTIDLEEAYFRYRKIDSNSSLTINKEWSKNYTLSKDLKIPFRPQTWSSDSVTFDKGFEYEVEVYGLTKSYSFPTSPDRKLTNVLLSNRVRFVVNGSYFLGLSPEEWTIAGYVAGVLGFVILAILAKKRFRKGGKK